MKIHMDEELIALVSAPIKDLRMESSANLEGSDSVSYLGSRDQAQGEAAAGELFPRAST